ncbi:MAG: flagellar export protein FliJ [bacterium]
MFRFRLQPVLRYRSWIEEQKQLVLAEKQRILMKETGEMERLKGLRVQYFEAMRQEAAREDLSITYLSFYQSYIFWIERAMDVQQERVAVARRDMEKAQTELIEAKKEKEVLVKTKNRALVRYNEAEQMKNQKFLDDISSVKHVRTMRGLDPFATNA